MASPVRNARLRINPYKPLTAGADATKDLIVRLKVGRIQKDISDGAMVIQHADQFQSTGLSFQIVQYVITLDGVLVEDNSHTAHPLTTSVEHDPDFVDLEEILVMWNNDFDVDDFSTYPTLEIEHDGVNGFRSYVGVIQGGELVQRAGHSEVSFKLRFGVTWDAKDNPGIREWL